MSATKFWDKIAPRYVKQPIAQPEAYANTLARTRDYLKPTDHLLEIGCGTGKTAIALAPSVAKLTATDISPRMIDIASAQQPPDKITFRTAPALATLDDAPFDAICAFNLLHLLDDLDQALAHLHSQLKPGGVLISKTTCVGDMSRAIRFALPVMRAIGKAPYVNVFTRETLESAFPRAGFTIAESRLFGTKNTAQFIAAHRT